MQRWHAVAAAMGLIFVQGALLGALSACGGDEGGPGAFTVTRPIAGEALVSGTMQPFRWNGGAGIAAVDIQFVATGGRVVMLASGLPNNGSADVAVHLLDADVRAGGRVRVVAAGSGAAGAMARLAAGAQPLVSGDGASDQVVTRVGNLAGLKSDGGSWTYYWLDMLTGESQALGMVGDLFGLPQETVAVDYQRELVYVIGDGGSWGALELALYVLGAQTGTLVRRVALEAYGTEIPLGLFVSNAGELLGFNWDVDGQTEYLVAVDTAAGTLTRRGAVGDLFWWQGQVAYNAIADVVYVLGAPGAMQSMGDAKVYTLAVSDGTLLNQALLTQAGSPLDDVLGVQVRSDGAMVGFHWNGSSEDLLRIDPGTGEATPFGTVGDLLWWSNVTAINLTNDLIYVIGTPTDITTPGPQDDRLYVMDALSGALQYSIHIADYPTNAALVY